MRLTADNGNVTFLRNRVDGLQELTIDFGEYPWMTDHGHLFDLREILEPMQGARAVTGITARFRPVNGHASIDNWLKRLRKSAGNGQVHKSEVTFDIAAGFGNGQSLVLYGLLVQNVNVPLLRDGKCNPGDVVVSLSCDWCEIEGE